MVKKHLFKTLLAGFLSAVIVAGSILPTFAADNNYDQDDSSGTVPVSFTIASTYTVSLPASVALNDSGENGDATASDGTYSSDATVGVKGNLAPNQYVTVTPTASTTLSVTGGTTDKVVNTTCTSGESGNTYHKWTSLSSSFDNKTVHFEAPDLSAAGSYSGTVSFAFALGTNEAP